MIIILFILVIGLIAWVYNNERAVNKNADLLEKLYDENLYERDIANARFNRIENYLSEIYFEQNTAPWKNFDETKMGKVEEIRSKSFPDMREQIPNMHSASRGIADFLSKH